MSELDDNKLNDQLTTESIQNENNPKNEITINEHQLNGNHVKKDKKKNKKNKSNFNSNDKLNNLEMNKDDLNKENVKSSKDESNIVELNKEESNIVELNTVESNKDELNTIDDKLNTNNENNLQLNEQKEDQIENAVINNENNQQNEKTIIDENNQLSNDNNEINIKSNEDNKLNEINQVDEQNKPKEDVNEIKVNDNTDKQTEDQLKNSKDSSIQNVNKNGNSAKTTKIPELLLTENNRPNNGNKLVIFGILLFKFVSYFIIQFICLFHPTKRHQLPSIDEPILLLSASEITKRIKDGEIKCESVIRAYINRIKNVNPKINAMVDQCFDDAIKKAKEIDEQLKDPKLAEELKKKPLLGVPFTCKDSISIKGLALTAGVKIREGIKAEVDATVIKNLKESGAINLGLTNTPEMVLWCDSHNKLYGRTNNPYDLSRIAGGSSGGEGALISAAGSLIGVGSDVGGSIRIPSMFNGTFGHKTTYKYVPVDHMFPPPPKEFPLFFCYGPICRYASDLPLMLKAMGGHLTDELRLDEPVDFRKLKIYYMEHDGGNPLSSFVDQRILNSMHKALKYFREEYGIETEKINITKFKYSLAFFGTACVKGEMKIEDFVSRTGHVNVYLELIKSLFGKSDITRPILIQILNQSSPYCDSQSSSYKRFTKMLQELKPKVHDMLGDNAVLWMPTWPTIAPKHQTTILRGFDASYTAIMNALEVAATHCPMGLTKEEGVPLGFTVAAGPGQDRLSIAFAKEIEHKFKGWVPPN